MRRVSFLSNSCKREAFIYGAKDFPMSSLCIIIRANDAGGKKMLEEKIRKEEEANMSRVMQDSSGQDQDWPQEEREKISNQDSDAIYPYRSVTGLFYEIDTRQFSTCWWPQKLYIAPSWDLNLARNTPGLWASSFRQFSKTVTMGVCCRRRHGMFHGELTRPLRILVWK